MAVKNLQDAFVTELRDLLSAEKQILKGLKKMARKANSEQLKAAFEEHHKETEGQVKRLEQAFDSLGLTARAHRCAGIEGILAEAEEHASEVQDEQTLDAVLIAAAQKVEHYEIAGYGSVCAWAEQLGHTKAKQLLGETLAEEKQTDDKLNQLAAKLNRQAQPS